MEHYFDTVIIGGGPAGAACGLTILRAGSVSCCIVDRAVFPRSKTCGGMMTEKTVSRLVELLSPFDRSLTKESLKNSICRERCDTVSIFDQNRLLSSAKVGYEMTLVERSEFDAMLLNVYQKQGGRLFEGETHWKIDFEKKLLYLTNGDLIRYRTLVAADGAESRVRQQLKRKSGKRAFCLEAHIPKDALDHRFGVSIYLNRLPGGYAWIFPAGDHYNVGIGASYVKGFDYRAQFLRFLSENGIASPGQYAIKGAFLPYTALPGGVTHGNSLLFVGDAAGFVDPIYGEGLYYALTSGKIAGEAVSLGKNAVKRYKKLIRPVKRSVYEGKLFRRFFYAPPIYRYFCKKLPGRESFLRFYADNQLSLARFPYHSTPKLLRTYKKEKSQYK